MPKKTINITNVYPPRANNPKYQSVKDSSGTYYSFPAGKFDFAAGTTVTVVYDENESNGKVYCNITDVMQATRQESTSAQGQSTYTTKDRVITRIAIAKSCIEEGSATIEDAQRWVDWVEGRYKQQEAPAPAARRQSQDDRPSQNNHNSAYQAGYDNGLDDEIPF